MAGQATADTAATRGFRILPSAGLLIEGGLISGSESGFTGLHRKTLDLNVFRIGGLDGTLLVTEDTLTTDRYSTRFYPYRITYVMDYFYLSWRFAGSTLGLLMDHICYNVLDKNGDTDPEQLRWYGAGLKWESIGMKIGQKDYGITFGAPGSFISFDRLNYSFYAGAALHTERFKYRSILRGSIRYDIALIGIMVPYVEGSIQALVDDRWRADRGAEAGARFRVARVNIIPYINYSFRHDALLYNGGDESSWLFGLRMESLLGETLPGLTPMARSGAIDFPELHFSGGYGKYYSSGSLGFLTELGVTIELLRYRGATLYASSDLAHDSKSEGNALYPRFLAYSFSGGADYYLLPEVMAGALYEHGRRHDGNAYRGVTERFHLAGIELFSPGMRRGRANHVSCPAGTQDFIINRLEWRLFAGRIVDESHYPYNWDFRMNLRWDIGRLFGAVPYAAPGYRFLEGTETGHEWEIESGLRFCTEVALMLYHRYERSIDIDRAGGMTDTHQVIGFRVER